MDGEKWSAALNALDRFLFDLLDPADEVFLYTFNTNPDLVQDWTTDRQRISRALGRIRPNGGTALLDAVSEAVPLADTGRHRKKAVVVISDGNDTSSHIDLPELKQLIRETEVLVYAIGIDGREPSVTTGPGGTGPRFPIPVPFPVPGRRYPSHRVILLRWDPPVAAVEVWISGLFVTLRMTAGDGQNSSDPVAISFRPQPPSRTS
jgi:hypothetical protein